MTGTLQGTTYKVGDLFTIEESLYPASCHGVVYRVTKRPAGSKGVNYTGEPVQWDDTIKRWVGPIPGRKGVRAPTYAMHPHDPDQHSLTSEPFVALPERAALVQFKPGPGHKDGLFVVTGYPRNVTNAVQLTRLGGDGGRYWKSVPVAWLDVIAPERVTVTD